MTLAGRRGCIPTQRPRPGSNPHVNILGQHVVKKPAIDPGIFIICRDVGASITLLVAARLYSGKWSWPDVADRFSFVLLGVCNVYFGQYCFVVGIALTDALTGSLWQNTLPVFTLVLSVIAGTENLPLAKRHSWIRLLGIGFTVAGAAAYSVLQASSKNNHEANIFLGTTFFFFQCLFGSWFFVIQKKLLKKYSSIHVVAWGYAVGGLLMVLVVLPQSLLADNGAGWDALKKPRVLEAVAFVIFISSSLCYGIYGWANKRSTPVFVVAIGPSQIIFTAVLRYFILGQDPSEGAYVGSALVTLGVVFFVAGQLMMEAEQVAAGKDANMTTYDDPERAGLLAGSIQVSIK